MLKSYFNITGRRSAVDILAIVLVSLFAFSSTAWAQDSDYSDSSAASQEPVYPGIAPQGKAEATLGSQKLRIYGTFLLNISGSDSVDVGQDLVLWAVPGGSATFPDGTTKPNSKIHDLIFTAR
jgi:hypothetical protein